MTLTGFKHNDKNLRKKQRLRDYYNNQEEKENRSRGKQGGGQSSHRKPSLKPSSAYRNAHQQPDFSAESDSQHDDSIEDPPLQEEIVDNEDFGAN